ncbi:hypothetical protein EDD11_002789 [Mortierella claussenii]|nr:hypothetical protein EDD11_002789 [Mortierella claussenii]
MNELNGVKFRRFAADKLPLRITSALGGTGDFLTEIRNVVKSKEDVQQLWGCDPAKIKVLGLDLEQAFVVGASAILPDRGQPTGEQGPSDVGRKDKFYSLAVKQKAVYQPTLKHRRWLDQRTGRLADGQRSVKDIESDLPDLRGTGASVRDYVGRPEDVEVHLDTFYNSVALKKHLWDARRAKAEEYRQITNSLLMIVGRSLSAKRKDKNKVIIGVGSCWNQIDVFHKYRDPSKSSENHAIIYKSDLENISGNSDIPASLRKVASNLARNFKHDEFVAKFAELTDVSSERNANQGVRNMFLKVAGNLGTGNGDHKRRLKGHLPKKIKIDATLENNVVETEITQTSEDGLEEIEVVDSEGDDEENEATASIEFDDEETEAALATEYDIEEVEVTVSPPNVLEKGTPARVAAVSALQQTLHDSYPDPAMKSRVKRFGQMDPTKLWKLSSGRTVEQVLFEKSVKGGASYKIRSYTIDYTCDITRKLFTDEEWTEVLIYNEWGLPDVEETTFNYLESVCAALQKGEHPTVVSFPAHDWTTCNLVLRTALAWMDLYCMKPCPLNNPGAHSEAFWARHGWPALKDLLNGVDGITMLDGEKFGLESTQHRNKSRRLDVEVKIITEKKATRKAAGSKLDLIARDTLNHRDWCVGEAKKDWDELSTEHLKHTAVDLFKKLHLISIYRCKERGADFRKQARFFSFFSGGNGFKAFQLRSSPKSAYISLFHEYPPHVLPTEAGDWVDQFLGLWFLLRVKIAATETIQLFNQRSQRNLRDLVNHVATIGHDKKESMVDECTLASSPLGPDVFDD